MEVTSTAVQPAQKRSRHLAPGDKLGKYDLIRQIAVGGMAELYLARTVGIEGFEKLVVVKRILPQYVANASFVDMFLNEARIAATLHHPNIAQVYDIGVDEGDYFFAMEYVHGEDLDHVSVTADEQGVPISLDAALTLIAHLCAALHYAHEKAGADGRPRSIVHRDVSPTNVLVSYDGVVKLVDFGIARAGTRPGRITQSGLKGKIAYMSPEQCRNTGHLDRRSDLFSVGMLLYELTTGQPPFTGDSEYAVLEQIVNRDAPPPRSIVPEYPEVLEQIVLTALARDPARRFPTALAMQAAIEDFAHERRLRVSPLVLARLMSTLFPARLEEWDQAKSQGAFFVEQHVVRTLIETGKGSDTVPLPPEFAESPAPDDDTTAVTGLPITADAQPLPPPPRLPSAPRRSSPVLAAVAPPAARAPTPVPAAGTRAPTPVLAAATRAPTPVPPASHAMPVPGMPGAVPIVAMQPAMPGSLVTASNAPMPIPAVSDVTEFVRAPPDGRGSSRRSIAVVVGGLAVAAAIAAFIALRGGPIHTAASGSGTGTATGTAAGTAAGTGIVPPSAPSAPSAPAATPATSMPVPATATATATAPATAPAAAAAPAPAAAPATATAAAPATAPAPTRAVVPHHTAHATHHASPARHASGRRAEHATPKEPTWNADSPFMPVRESH